MTKGVKILRFAAQTLGGATLIGLWIEYTKAEWLRTQKMAMLFALAMVLLLLLGLAAKRLLGVRYLPALGKMTVCFISGVLLGLAMTALILLLAEMNTAFVGMMTLIRHGGQ